GSCRGTALGQLIQLSMVVIPALCRRTKARFASGPSISGAEVTAIVSGCDGAKAAAAGLASARATARTTLIGMRQRCMIERKAGDPGRQQTTGRRNVYPRMQGCARRVQTRYQVTRIGYRRAGDETVLDNDRDTGRLLGSGDRGAPL